MKCFDHLTRPGRARLLPSRDSGSVTARREPRSTAGQRGVALVITLLMLVIITVMAVAFLLLSQRETASVAALHSTTDSELAADAGLEQSKALALQPFLVGAAPTAEVMGPDLTVSAVNPANPDTNRLAPATLRGIVSPPVFVNTNRSGVWDNAVPLEDRFYLDLNENRRFEETGLIKEVDGAGNQTGADAAVIGDPQWFGLLQDPSRAHAGDNRFIARYSYLIQPIGRSLDVNWIHNDVKDINLGAGFAGYFRNEGVGSFENNLAAFLTDLNTNEWNPSGNPYVFDPNPSPSFGSKGWSFSNALSLLNYRYADNKANLFSPKSLLPGGVVDFESDFVDNFGNGPIAALGASLQTVNAETGAWRDSTNAPWPGAGNPRNFSSIREFFDRSPSHQTHASFTLSLSNASRRTSTYDRYTYYRMLAQLGTDSAPEEKEKIDLNYQNTWDLRLRATGRGFDYDRSKPRRKASEFIPWTAETFFHVAGDTLLTNEFYPLGNTNIGLLDGRSIPVFLNNSEFGRLAPLPIVSGGSLLLYSPRIHQLLQIAANLYEAQQSNFVSAPTYPEIPHTYRPVFEAVNGVIHIVRHDAAPIATSDVLPMNVPPFVARYRWFVLGQNASPDDNTQFFDIPIIFGAMKGIPSLNEFTMQSIVQVSRRVRVSKSPATAPTTTNFHQSFQIGVSNLFAAELINSATNFPNAANAYPRQLLMVVSNQAESHLYIDVPPTGTPIKSATQAVMFASVRNPFTWKGSNPEAGAFSLAVIPGGAQVTLSNSVYYHNAGLPQLVPYQNTNQIDMSDDLSYRRWELKLTNRVLYFLIDSTSNRLVDAFSSARMTNYFDITGKLQEDEPLQGNAGVSFARLWRTNLVSYHGTFMSEGVRNQVLIARGQGGTVDASIWADAEALLSKGIGSRSTETTGFDNWMNSINTPAADTAILSKDTPFNPSRKFAKAVTWRANDPFVHYTLNDLFDGDKNTGIEEVSLRSTGTPTRPPYKIDLGFENTCTLGKVNGNYEPWAKDLDAAYCVFADRDPGIFNSDNWDFPHQKYPNVGWIGRVHRGTPWQTIYLKPADVAHHATLGGPVTQNAWRKHTGAAYMVETYPTNDWRMLDLFTTAIHPNLTRGRLSINQTNLAAWSAVFSGVTTATAADDGTGLIKPGDRVIEPSAIDLNVSNLVASINDQRRLMPNGQFHRLGEFLSSPALLTNYLGDPQALATPMSRVRDVDYERLAGQIAGLVKVGEPRFVVYAWGQSLKPAERGVEQKPNDPNIYPTGPSVEPGTKLVKNYQITGETAMRAVVKIEFTYSNDAAGKVVRRPHAVIESFNIIPAD